MNYTVLRFMVTTVLIHVVASAISPDSVRQGSKMGYDMFVDRNTSLIALTIAATLIAGLVQAVIPKEVIANSHSLCDHMVPHLLPRVFHLS